MQRLPLVSIVTPAYNQAEYLAETIDSVLAQDYSSIEYIVLDDGSTDSTPEILRRYDGRIRWERHDNMGQACTLNKGWLMSHGSVIGYLSSDDRLLPDAVTTLVNTLQANPQAVVAYCDFALIDGAGHTIKTVMTEDFSRHRLTQDIICQPGPGALFQRHLIDTVGGWNQNLRQIPDYEFWLRAASVGDFVRVRKILAQFRIHEGSSSFRPVSPERSMEIVQTMIDYWGNDRTLAAKKSMARANIIASRSHAQSGRPIQSLKRLIFALCVHPQSTLCLKALVPIASGMLRRAYYKIVHKTKSS